MPDATLLDRVGSGEEAAFVELVRRHEQRLTAQARKILPEGGDDAVQTALMHAYRAIRNGRRPDDLAAWLTTIVRNAAISERRRSRETEPLEDIASGRSTLDEVSDRDRVRRLVAAARDLPAFERQALASQAFEGMSYAEIALARGTTVGSVRMAIYRARAKLRAAAPALLPLGLLDLLRRGAGRARDASALTGTAAAAGAVAAVATAAMVVGGSGGEGGNERVTVTGTGGGYSAPVKEQERKRLAYASIAAHPPGPPPPAPGAAGPPSEPAPQPPSPPVTSPPADPGAPPVNPPTIDPPSQPVDPAPPPPVDPPAAPACRGPVSCLLHRVGRVLNP